MKFPRTKSAHSFVKTIFEIVGWLFLISAIEILDRRSETWILYWVAMFLRFMVAFVCYSLIDEIFELYIAVRFPKSRLWIAAKWTVEALFIGLTLITSIAITDLVVQELAALSIES